MPSRAQLDLRRPAHVRQQARYIHGDSGERPDLLRQCYGALRAHPIERHRARWYRRGMTVLQPQDYALVCARRRQSGIAVGRPGIRIMRAGQAGAVI